MATPENKSEFAEKNGISQDAYANMLKGALAEYQASTEPQPKETPAETFAKEVDKVIKDKTLTTKEDAALEKVREKLNLSHAEAGQIYLVQAAKTGAYVATEDAPNMERNIEAIHNSSQPSKGAER